MKLSKSEITPHALSLPVGRKGGQKEAGVTDTQINY